MLALTSSPDQQEALLAAPGLPSIQRQAVARGLAARLGNRNIQRLLEGRRTQPTPQVIARQGTGKQEIDTINASHFTVAITQPLTIAGDYTATRQGKGNAAILNITAPKISMDAKVSFQASQYEFAEDDGVRVGPVQTLTSSVRTGVYVKDGQEVARYSSKLNNLRDARPQSYEGEAGPSFKAEKPFYDRPNPITDQIVDAQVNFVDQPTAPFPIYFGGGTLSRIEGSDDFNTSIGIKQTKTGTLLLLNPFGWRANWSMTLDANLGIALDAQGKTTAKGLETWEETTGRVVDSDEAAFEIANRNQPIFTFLTVEAAMNESAVSLWLALAAARSEDPTHVANIEQALIRKNPTFRAQLTVNKACTGRHWSLTKSDTVEVWANANKQSPNRGPTTIEEGQSANFDFSLTEIIDPGAITTSSTLTVWAGGNDKSNPILGDSVELPYPFLSGGEISVSSADQESGRYTVNVSMA